MAGLRGDPAGLRGDPAQAQPSQWLCTRSVLPYGMVEAGGVCEPSFPGWLGHRSPCMAGVPKGARGITLEKGIPIPGSDERPREAAGPAAWLEVPEWLWPLQVGNAGAGSGISTGTWGTHFPWGWAFGCGLWCLVFSEHQGCSWHGRAEEQPSAPSGLIPSPRDYGSGLFNARISAALGLLCLQLSKHL